MTALGDLPPVKELSAQEKMQAVSYGREAPGYTVKAEVLVSLANGSTKKVVFEEFRASMNDQVQGPSIEEQYALFLDHVVESQPAAAMQTVFEDVSALFRELKDDATTNDRRISAVRDFSLFLAIAGAFSQQVAHTQQALTLADVEIIQGELIQYNRRGSEISELEAALKAPEQEFYGHYGEARQIARSAAANLNRSQRTKLETLQKSQSEAASRIESLKASFQSKYGMRVEQLETSYAQSVARSESALSQTPRLSRSFRGLGRALGIGGLVLTAVSLAYPYVQQRFFRTEEDKLRSNLDPLFDGTRDANSFISEMKKHPDLWRQIRNAHWKLQSDRRAGKTQG